MELYIVRHGEVSHNVLKQYNTKDEDLTKIGVKQAEKLRDKIKYGTSEDIKLFFNRVFNFLEELKTKDYKIVLIVAHSGVSKAFSAYFDGLSDGKFLNRGLKNCEIKKYQL